MSDKSEKDSISNMYKQINHSVHNITAKHTFIFATVVIFSLIVSITIVYGFQHASERVLIEVGLLVLLLSMAQHVITFAYAMRWNSLNGPLFIFIGTMAVGCASVLIVGLF